MDVSSSISTGSLILLGVDFLVRVGLSLRVIVRRGAVGVSLAWLTVIMVMPVVGGIVYLLFGERYVGRLRATRANVVNRTFHDWFAHLCYLPAPDWSGIGRRWKAQSRLTQTLFEIPTLAGNDIELLSNAEEFFRRLLHDIREAKRHCHLNFYIWQEGGWSDTIIVALIEAHRRGVVCRLIGDGIGSRPFFRSQAARRLREEGIVLVEALPAALWRLPYARLDLRNHRKIVIIDDRVAYTGSQNLVDPRYFKQDAGVGEWIDAMIRFTGPAVHAMAGAFLEDWELERGEGLRLLHETLRGEAPAVTGSAAIQVIPSGPTRESADVHSMLIQAIFSAREEVVLTTPYFIPDEPLLFALVSAARRGVTVRIVLPKELDSRLVHYASQAHKGDLLAAGVYLYEFPDGLLHTKSITLDREVSLFGSLNLDQRSFWLSFEITVAIYDRHFTGKLRELQQSYMERSHHLQYEEWAAATPAQRFLQNVARLLSPLL